MFNEGSHNRRGFSLSMSSHLSSSLWLVELQIRLEQTKKMKPGKPKGKEKNRFVACILMERMGLISLQFPFNLVECMENV